MKKVYISVVGKTAPPAVRKPVLKTRKGMKQAIAQAAERGVIPAELLASAGK